MQLIYKDEMELVNFRQIVYLLKNTGHFEGATILKQNFLH